MTKTSRKNLILWLGVSAGFATVFGTSAALYFTAGNIENIASKKEYLIRASSPLTLDGYYFDMSATYGPAANKAPETLLSSGLIRVETTGETKFIKNSEGNLVVSQSSKERLVLDLGKEVILTFKNAIGDVQYAVFDSDEAEINPSTSTAIVKPETVKLKSNNQRSLNSDYFDELMLGEADFVDGKLVPVSGGMYQMRSLSFSVKEDTYWVDSNGNKTIYKIQPKDFYYSYMRTWLYDSKYRRENGGSSELDKYFINESGTSNRLTDDKKYPNNYLLGLFGISSTLLQNEQSSVKTITIDGVEKDVFNIESIPTEVKPAFSPFLYKTFLNAYLLSPAPAEFIDKLAEETKNIEYPVSSTSKEKVTGHALKFGIYTYGQKRTDNLFSSSYIPTSAEKNRIVFTKNLHFSNKEFLMEENSLERIIFEFSTSPAFNEQLFNNYFEGTVSEMPYSSLTQQQKIKIFGSSYDEEFAVKKGLLQVKQQNKAQLVQRTLLTTDPRKLSDGDGSYYFNDQYARLVYGSSIDDLRSGVGKTANSFFNGPGYQLRTLLNASVNWYTFVNNSSNGLKQLWLNHTAPDARYSFSSNKTPFDYADKINNIGYFDQNGKKVVITEAQMKQTYESNSDSIENQYKNPGFNEMKTLVEKLLDDNNITTPLEWQIIYPYIDAISNTVTINQLKLVEKTIKDLDSKGRLNPSLFIPNSRDEMLDSINSNKAVSDFGGWGYDYEGIGSFLDGISHQSGVTLLSAFSLYSNPANITIRSQNPEFTKLSDRIKQYLNPSLPAGLKVEDWIEFTNDDNNNLDAKFGSYQFGTEIAKFFLMYQEELNDDEITDLIIELNIIAGFAMEADISINDARSTSLSLVLPEYLFPTTRAGILYLSDIRVGDKDE
ncbi:MAG: OppA family ABC transporter substrate-binding lipoprotein [Metamycoplasmataceae bacterium]